MLNIDFVLLDNSPLKFALLSHCNEWQNKFTTLLREMGSQKLLELHNFLKDNAKKYVLYNFNKTDFKLNRCSREKQIVLFSGDSRCFPRRR